MPPMLLRVVFTDLPSKCNQSKGAGLFGLKRIGRRPELEERGIDPDGEEGGNEDPWAFAEETVGEV